MRLHYPLSDLLQVCSDSKRMGVQRLLDAVVTALERHAYAGQMFDGRQIELLQLLAGMTNLCRMEFTVMSLQIPKSTMSAWID